MEIWRPFGEVGERSLNGVKKGCLCTSRWSLSSGLTLNTGCYEGYQCDSLNCRYKNVLCVINYTTKKAMSSLWTLHVYYLLCNNLCSALFQVLKHTLLNVSTSMFPVITWSTQYILYCCQMYSVSIVCMLASWLCHFLSCQSLMESWSDDSWNCCHNRRNSRHGDTPVYHSSALLL